jgi:hypothetical protein
VDKINRAIRSVRRERGDLGEDHQFETSRGKQTFAAGDRIQIIGTDKQRGLLNGHAGTIAKIEDTTIHMQLDGQAGRTIAFDAKEFKEFRHGYAGTIYKGQGRTLDQTYLYHSEHWRSAASYVALTRHRDKAEVFVARNTAQNLKELARQMARVDNRKAASHYYRADGAQSGDAASQSATHDREPKSDDRPTEKAVKPGRKRLADDLAEARRSATTLKNSLPEGQAQSGEETGEEPGRRKGPDRGGGRSL